MSRAIPGRPSRWNAAADTILPCPFCDRIPDRFFMEDGSMKFGCINTGCPAKDMPACKLEVWNTRKGMTFLPYS
jgi:hypothetical protein